MKQIRKMSNLVAEELQSALNENGVKLDESVFEEKVSQIVSIIGEAVVSESQINEDDKFYVATQECSIGGKKVAEGEYVELEDTDDGKIATIYDEDGNIKESDISVDDDDVKAFEGSAEELNEDDVEEGSCPDCGKELDEGGNCPDCGELDEATKAEIKKARKMRDKGRTATGNKKLKGAALAKFLRSHKKMFKNRHKGNADKRASKTRKKNAQKGLYDGKVSGTVTESFDIHSDGMTFTAEAGDTIVMESGSVSVFRNGSAVLSGLTVSEGFFGRCTQANVVEMVVDGDSSVNESTSPSIHTEESAAILTFKASTGYSLVKEGRELPLGNRIRARATLVSEGYNITSNMLDSASRGEMVTL